MLKVKRVKFVYVKFKFMLLFYNKVCELVLLLGDFVDIQVFIDIDVLQVYVLVLYFNGLVCLKYEIVKCYNSQRKQYFVSFDIILVIVFIILC